MFTLSFSVLSFTTRIKFVNFCDYFAGRADAFSRRVERQPKSPIRRVLSQALLEAGN